MTELSDLFGYNAFAEKECGIDQNVEDGMNCEDRRNACCEHFFSKLRTVKLILQVFWEIARFNSLLL